MPTIEEQVRERQIAEYNAGGSGVRSFKALTQGLPGPNTYNAEIQLAVFQDQALQSDYRTLGEAADTKYDELNTAIVDSRIGGGIPGLQELLLPPQPPRPKLRASLDEFRQFQGAGTGSSERPEDRQTTLAVASDPTDPANPLAIKPERERKSLRNPDQELASGLQIPV